MTYHTTEPISESDAITIRCSNPGASRIKGFRLTIHPAGEWQVDIVMRSQDWETIAQLITQRVENADSPLINIRLPIHLMDER